VHPPCNLGKAACYWAGALPGREAARWAPEAEQHWALVQRAPAATCHAATKQQIQSKTHESPKGTNPHMSHKNTKRE